MWDMFQQDFMVRSFLAGGAIAVAAPLIGMFLVVRRYSLLADTLAHVSLVGVALGLILNTQPVLTAVVTSVFAALGIERIRRTRHLVGDSVLAIFLSGSLAIASVLLSLARGFNVNLLSFLFGSITTVQRADVFIIVTLALLVVVVIVALYKEFFAISLNEELAQTSGIPAGTLGLLLVILAAVTVSLAMRIVGALLIGALMVIPVVTAMQVGRSFRETMVVSVVVSLLAVFLGLTISYVLGLPSGGTVVVVALAMFGVSILLKPTNA